MLNSLYFLIIAQFYNTFLISIPTQIFIKYLEIIIQFYYTLLINMFILNDL